MFCPKCGAVLLPKKEEGRKLLVCSCGFKSSKIEAPTIRETITKKAKEVEVIDRGELDILPKTKALCSKCGNNEAHFWLIQTRAGDEPETKFLRCTKCGHTWRDYS